MKTIIGWLASHGFEKTSIWLCERCVGHKVTWYDWCVGCRYCAIVIRKGCEE